MTQRIKVLLAVRPVWLLALVIIVAFVAGILTPVTANFRGPIVDINDAILIAVLIALGAFVAQLYVDRGQLYARIGKLEADLKGFRDENSSLRDDLAAAASFINRIGWWVTQGMPPSKRPRPPQQLAEHIDAELWASGEAVGDAVGGTD